LKSFVKYNFAILISLLVAFTTLIPVNSFAAEEPVPGVTTTMLDSTHGLIIFPVPVTLSDTAAITFDVNDVKIKSYIIPPKGGKELHFYLIDPLKQPVRVTISGDIMPVSATDAAPIVKNLLLMPVVWPANRQNMAFLWESNNAPNLVLFPDDVNYTSCKLTGDSKIFDNKGRVQCNSGFAVSKVAIVSCLRNKALSFELTFTPGITLANTNLMRIGNIVVKREGAIFLVELPGDKTASKTIIKTTPLQYLVPPTTIPFLITINPKEITIYQQGTKVGYAKLSPNFFSRWKGNDIAVGSALSTTTNAGSIDGIAIYSRTLSAKDAEISAEAAAKRITPMETPQIVVKAKLIAMTPTPLPKDILPYKHALITHKYLVSDVIKGYKTTVNKDATILVARWGILSAKQTAIANMKVGDECELTLENFKDHPDLEHQYTVDALSDEDELPYMLDVGKK